LLPLSKKEPVGKSRVHGVWTLVQKEFKEPVFNPLNCTVLKTIEELVKETYLEVSVLCLSFSKPVGFSRISRLQTRRLF
jgi:hypothetical protein